MIGGWNISRRFTQRKDSRFIKPLPQIYAERLLLREDSGHAWGPEFSRRFTQRKDSRFSKSLPQIYAERLSLREDSGHAWGWSISRRFTQKDYYCGKIPAMLRASVFPGDLRSGLT